MKRFACGVLVAAMLTTTLAAPAFAKTFSDTQGHWGESAIEQVTDWELFRGTGEDRFSPDATMTRGMFVTVMARTAAMLNVYQEASKEITFVDVAENDYFASSVAWAQENGLVLGVDDTHFAPDQYVTREQMCVIMTRFLEKFTEYDLTPYQNLGNSFVDKDSISAYAAESVDLCVALGLIKGVQVNGGLYFNPKDTASRASVAVAVDRMVPVTQELPPVPEQPAEGGMGGEGQQPGGEDEPTEEEKQDEAKMAEYLQIMLNNYRNSTYLPTTEKVVQDSMAILMNCISDALVQRQSGQFLDRTFVREHYETQIQALREAYDGFTETQLNQMNNVIVRLASTEQIYFVMDYFGVSVPG